MYIMKKQGDNMKLSELVNEVNTEQELSQLCDKLVADLTEEHLRQYPTLTEYSYEYKVSRKYIKVIMNSGNQRSVWGFINKSDWTKSSGITFKCGDVLMSAGWNTPALNAPRGNLFDGYQITGMRKYGPDYLR
jgi:hypothetical protein|tara:strand:+ start:2263 stop:2661 length:399 start_codon:yes stop_codon:yes gene_type:complete